MAKKEFAVRSIKVTFNLEEIENGKLQRVQEIPAVIFEGQFDQTLGSLAQKLLEQANSSLEPTAEGKVQKEE